MAAIDAVGLLRPGLLEGRRMLVAGSREDSLGAAVKLACAGLGARVASYEPPADGDGEEEQERAAAATLAAALAGIGGLDVLVLDGDGLLARGGSVRAAQAALIACLQAAWTTTRSAFEAAWAPAGRGGRIVYLAPAPGGEHAEPARAGLENLARTLSIEWARHEVTAVTIAPGRRSTAGEVAALTAYLASPAGAYFSGCLLDLRGA